MPRKYWGDYVREMRQVVDEGGTGGQGSGGDEAVRPSSIILQEESKMSRGGVKDSLSSPLL
jgi:hypothetical protein